MSWASKIRAHSASKQRKPRKPPPVVQSTWAQTRYPDEGTGDPGEVIDIHYTFEDHAVTLTDEKGVPIGGKASAYVLQPGEAPVRIAKLMGRTRRDRETDAPSDVSWVV